MGKGKCSGKADYTDLKVLKLVDWFKPCLQSLVMKQHVLIVDDEEQMRDLLSLYLQKHGYEVSVASSSTETLQMVDERQVHMVVLDIGLGGEDGLKLLSAIKKRRPDTQVVMLTGMGFVEDLLIEAHQKGADGYVSKGLPMDELLLAIHRASKPLLVVAR